VSETRRGARLASTPGNGHAARRSSGRLDGTPGEGRRAERRIKRWDHDRAGTDAIRFVLAAAREDPESAPNDSASWVKAIAARLAHLERPSLRPVINATGVVLHTNLGRAPLPIAALHAITETAAVACNLEYDLERGERGSRYVHAVALLRELTGAEDAIVVSNCASALVLALNSLSAGREAIVSRGELIEIGGSFRVPDIMSEERRHARGGRHHEPHAPRGL
jgi:hypothetical protein